MFIGALLVRKSNRVLDRSAANAGVFDGFLWPAEAILKQTHENSNSIALSLGIEKRLCFLDRIFLCQNRFDELLDADRELVRRAFFPAACLFPFGHIQNPLKYIILSREAEGVASQLSGCGCLVEEECLLPDGGQIILSSPLHALRSAS